MNCANGPEQAIIRRSLKFGSEALRYSTGNALRTVGFLALFFGIMVPTVAHALALDVKGTISCSVFLEGKTMTNWTYPFDFSVSGRTWKIKVVFAADNVLRVGSDGSNTFSLVGPPLQSDEPTTSAIITPGAYPIGENWYVSLPWLAFASDSWLDTAKNLPAAWLNPLNDPPASIVASVVNRFDSETRLPSSIRYNVKKISMAEIQKLGWLKPSSFSPDRLRVNDYYPDGHLLANYEVVRRTNIDNSVIPTEFILTCYSLTASNVVDQVITGTVSSISQSTMTNPLPELTKKVGFIDFRFRDYVSGVDEIEYFNPDGIGWVQQEPKWAAAKLEQTIKYLNSTHDGRR